MLATKTADHRTEHACIAAHNRRTTMSEDRLIHMRPVAPIELGRDRCMADQHATFLADNRAPQRCAIAEDTDVA
jgi:hypothetical protein